MSKPAISFLSLGRPLLLRLERKVCLLLGLGNWKALVGIDGD